MAKFPSLERERGSKVVFIRDLDPERKITVIRIQKKCMHLEHRSLATPPEQTTHQNPFLGKREKVYQIPRAEIALNARWKLDLRL